LDRTTGKFVLGKPFSKVTWATGLDEAGRPMRVQGMEPSADAVKIYPGAIGATNWYPPSFSPRTGLMYISAWDDVYGDFTKTGVRKWEFKMNDVTTSGILTTASDLLFTGGREGFFQVLDARDGKLLWKVAAGAEIAMGPMTYSVSGKQYVAFSAGSSLFVYG